MVLDPRKRRPTMQPAVYRGPLPSDRRTMEYAEYAEEPVGYPNPAPKRRLPPAQFEGDAPFDVPPPEGLGMQPHPRMLYGNVEPDLPLPPGAAAEFGRRQLPPMGGMAGWRDRAGQQADLRSLYAQGPEAPPPTMAAKPRRGFTPPATPEEYDARMQEAGDAARNDELRRMERRARHPRLISFMREFSRPGILQHEREVREQREAALAKAYADAGIPRPAGGFTGRAITDPQIYEDLYAAMESDRERDFRLKLQRERSMMLRAMDIDPGMVENEALWHILNDEVLDEKWLKLIPRPMPELLTIGGRQVARDRFSGKMTNLGPAPMEAPPAPSLGEPFWDPGSNAGRGGYRLLNKPASSGKTPESEAAKQYQKDMKAWDKEHYTLGQNADREIKEAELARRQAVDRLAQKEAFLPDGTLDPTMADSADVLVERQKIEEADGRIAAWKKTMKDHEGRRPKDPGQAQPQTAPGPGGAPPAAEQGQAEGGAILDGEQAIAYVSKRFQNGAAPQLLYDELRGLRFPPELARIVMGVAGIPTQGLVDQRSLATGNAPVEGPGAAPPPQAAPAAPPAEVPGTMMSSDHDVISKGVELLKAGHGEETVAEALESILRMGGMPAQQAEDEASFMVAEAQLRVMQEQDAEGEEDEE